MLRRWWVLVAALGLVGTLASARELDWCAPIVVRPDQRLHALSRTESPRECRFGWTDAETAAWADYVYLEGGNNDEEASPEAGFTAQEPYSLTCFAKKAGDASDQVTYSRSSAWYATLCAQATLAGRPCPKRMKALRSDLAMSREMTLPGFDPAWLVRTLTPRSAVVAFFAGTAQPYADTNGFYSSSNTCRGASSASRLCLVDIVNQRAGQPLASGTAADDVVGYLNIRSPGFIWPSAYLFNLDIPAARAWKVARAQAAIASGADLVDHNHKIQQYGPTGAGCGDGQHWAGSSCFPDYASIVSSGDTPWTAQPNGYGYVQYIHGWRKLAEEYAGASVPFGVTLGRSMFGSHSGPGFGPETYTSTSHEDPATLNANCTGDGTGTNAYNGCCTGPGAGLCNEAVEIRRVATTYADVVFLDTQGRANLAATEALCAAIRQGPGSPECVVIGSSDPECSWGRGVPKYRALR